MPNSQGVLPAPVAMGRMSVVSAIFASLYATPPVYVAGQVSNLNLLRPLGGLDFLTHGIQNYAKSMSILSRWGVVLYPLHSIADFAEKRVVAARLLPVLQREIKYLEHKDTICRPREVEVRATCGKKPRCFDMPPTECTRHLLNVTLLFVVDVSPMRA